MYVVACAQLIQVQTDRRDIRKKAKIKKAFGVQSFFYSCEFSLVSRLCVLKCFCLFSVLCFWFFFTMKKVLQSTLL